MHFLEMVNDYEIGMSVDRHLLRKSRLLLFMAPDVRENVTYI